MKARALIVTVIVAMMPFASSKAATISRTPVSFTVTNPADPLHGSYTISGSLIRPEGCTSSVLLALHGLSYGAWAWDFPIDPSKYSVAQTLAQRGYAMITIDELGYGTDHPNGYTLSVQAYADMTAQIITQIRNGTYSGGPEFSHVAVIGHSAGTEIAELTTALHPDLVDALIATSYTHEPFVNNKWLVREWSRDNIRSAKSDYEYFETNPQIRAKDMYNLDNADPGVVAKDTSLANLTPSGEIYSIGSQPSRFLLPTIGKPVLVLLGGKDTLFPASFGNDEMRWFQGTNDKKLDVVEDAGHVFMLQKDAQVGDAMIADWLDAHAAAMPEC